MSPLVSSKLQPQSTFKVAINSWLQEIVLGMVKAAFGQVGVTGAPLGGQGIGTGTLWSAPIWSWTAASAVIASTKNRMGATRRCIAVQFDGVGVMDVDVKPVQVQLDLAKEPAQRSARPLFVLSTDA